MRALPFIIAVVYAVPSASWGGTLPREEIQPGTRLRLRIPGATFEAALVTWAPDAVVVARIGGQAETVPSATLRRVDAFMGRRSRGAMIGRTAARGAAIGAALGVAAALAARSGPVYDFRSLGPTGVSGIRPHDATEFVVFIPAGAVVGAAIGALVGAVLPPSDRWKRVSLKPASHGGRTGQRPTTFEARSHVSSEERT